MLNLFHSLESLLKLIKYFTSHHWKSNEPILMMKGAESRDFCLWMQGVKIKSRQSQSTDSSKKQLVQQVHNYSLVVMMQHFVPFIGKHLSLSANPTCATIQCEFPWEQKLIGWNVEFMFPQH